MLTAISRNTCNVAARFHRNTDAEISNPLSETEEEWGSGVGKVRAAPSVSENVVLIKTISNGEKSGLYYLAI